MSLTPPASPKADASSASIQQEEISRRKARDQAVVLAKERQEAHAVALSRVAQAEEEIQAAVRARDEATHCIQATQAHATQERAAAAAALAGPHPRPPEMHAPGDLQAAMLLQEAAVLLNIHA